MSAEPNWARMPESGNAQPEMEYVGFWARVGATLIDTIMLLIITLPLTYLVYGRVSSPGRMAQGPVDVVINWLLPAVIVLWLWWQMQATPGKLAMSARIVDADTGEAPTLTQFLIRYVGYFVSSIPLGVGIFWVGLDRRKQGWHDKMANTVVVRPTGKEIVKFPRGKTFADHRDPSA